MKIKIIIYVLFLSIFSNYSSNNFSPKKILDKNSPVFKYFHDINSSNLPDTRILMHWINKNFYEWVKKIPDIVDENYKNI